ncbi:hypothetical protein U9M48_001266 [Paspalum notatum var. saurae]|uniref:Uncharacterized protein n=1 Tax=Paspalum notatum var. saurae TaxID=547442 RepID=A0AAQ3PHW3_PASNO
MQHQVFKHLILIGAVLLWLLGRQHSFAGPFAFLLYMIIPIIPLLDPSMAAAFPDHLIHLLLTYCNVAVLGQEHNAIIASAPLDNGRFSVLSSPPSSCSKSLAAMLQPKEAEERI